MQTDSVCEFTLTGRFNHPKHRAMEEMKDRMSPRVGKDVVVVVGGKYTPPP